MAASVPEPAGGSRRTGYDDPDLLDRPGFRGIGVMLGGERYLLPLPDVVHIAVMPEVTRVPGLPRWVLGLANWRGRVLAVVDLRTLLGLPGVASHGDPDVPAARLAVVAAGGITVGLRVDAVGGVLQAAGSAGRVPVTGGAAGLVVDVVQVGSETVGVLSAAGVVGLRSLLGEV
ncbi:MAG: chemotaxis protein CheW [Actinomycetes bacterium]